MTTKSDRLVARLIEAGFSEDLALASLPEWWTDDEQNSSSARTLVSLLLARRLSLDPETLLDEGSPIGFLSTGPAKFKHLRLAAGARRDALVAFAHGVSRILLSVSPAEQWPLTADARRLRQALMKGRPFVSFGDILTACWAMGVPVLHLRLFPARTKGVTAIAVRIGHRHVILVARESGLEAQYMFHVAHELGHIALGHLKDVSAIVDADPNDPDNLLEELVDDEEERLADQWAQELLTGDRNFEVTRPLGAHGSRQFGTARELADKALQVAGSLGVDPGHIIMCFGFSSHEWDLAVAAAQRLPTQPARPGAMVNRVLWSQIDSLGADEQSLAYLQAVASA